MKKIFVDIYLAFNLGDDLFLDILAKKYNAAEITVNYTGLNYDGFLSRYSNVSKRKYSLFSKISNRIKITNTLTNYGKIAETHDILIFMGGSIFREEKYHESLYRERMNLVKEFKKRGKPTLVLGSNFGPHQSEKFLNDYVDFFKQCHDICFRDLYSFNKFKNLPNVRYAPDIVLQKDVEEYKNNPKNKIGISIIDLRHKFGLSGYYNSYVNNTIKSIELLTKKGFECCLMSFCSLEGDLETIKFIISLLSPQALKKVSIFDYKGNIEEAIKLIATFNLIIAARFHANILGLLLNVTILPIIYNSKTSNMLNDNAFDGTMIKMENIDMICDENLLIKSINSKNNIDIIPIKSKEHFKKLDELLTLNEYNQVILT